MSWIDIIAPEDADGSLADVYDEVAGRRGKVANVMRVHSLNPEAMQTHMGLYQCVMFDRCGLSREERELIATAVSATNGCDYCKHHHAVALDAYWNDAERVESFMDDWRSVDLSSRKRAMVEYAVELTKNPGEMHRGCVDDLSDEGLSDEEVLAVALVAGYFNFVNRIAQGLGVEFSEEEMRGYEY